MQALTGLNGFDWLLVLLYAFGGALLLQSWRRDVPGWRIAGFLLVPAASGVLLLALVAVRFRPDTEFLADRLLERKEAVVGLGLAIVFTLVVVDYLLSRVVAALERFLRRLPLSAGPNLVLVIGTVLPVVAALVLLGIVERRTATGYDRSLAEPSTGASVRASYPLPGQPMDLVLLRGTEGYVSFAEGWIGRIELPANGGAPRVRRVATGLERPRGIAIVDSTLYVAELGRMPCESAVGSCKGGDVSGQSVEETERAILRDSRARILAFAIRADGSLGPGRPILTALPVANSDHAVNDVEAGPDGSLYVSIGHLDRLYDARNLTRELRRPRGRLLGTVVSVEPDGTGLRVVARGLRNVYGLAFGRSGALFGVDNDGPTRGSWRREEVVRIVDGANFGYPVDGSFGPYVVRDTEPLWVLDDAVGSGGLEVVTGREGAETLIVGGCSSVDAVELSRDRRDRVFVASRSDVTRLLALPGCVTAVETTPSGLALTVFTFTGPPQLTLIELEG